MIKKIGRQFIFAAIMIMTLFFSELYTPVQGKTTKVDVAGEWRD